MSTPFTPFQLAMLREGEARENKRDIQEYEDGLLYELTQKAKDMIKPYRQMMERDCINLVEQLEVLVNAMPEELTVEDIRRNDWVKRLVLICDKVDSRVSRQLLSYVKERL